MSLYWTARARRDLLEIGRYIPRDNTAAARRWIKKLPGRARQAAAAPRAGRTAPEAGRDDVREVFLKTYRIAYRVQEHDIHVLTVFEGHRVFPSDALPENETLVLPGHETTSSPRQSTKSKTNLSHPKETKLT